MLPSPSGGRAGDEGFMNLRLNAVLDKSSNAYSATAILNYFIYRKYYYTSLQYD